MEKFILTRKGEFKPYRYTDNQCKGKGHKAYLYKVAITCGTKLDKDGFVIDHMDIHNLIKELRLEGSCEHMCNAITVNLRFLLRSKEIQYFKIHIKIKPKIANPVAYIQYIWE